MIINALILVVLDKSGTTKDCCNLSSPGDLFHWRLQTDGKKCCWRVFFKWFFWSTEPHQNLSTRSVNWLSMTLSLQNWLLIILKLIDKDKSSVH